VSPKPVIDIRHISKSYTLGAIGMTSLREEVERLWSRSPRVPRETFWALRDVSFDVQRGEVVGIIGRNGAGKSTLLKILSRVTQQTIGEITLRGRVASLLEVGTGFHPELSGRENVFLNGAILGMTKAQITRRFDEIVAFAEVEQFIDTPVKRYSSGMYVRLAFAVAAHLETDILIVDEVLAVGDASFQAKCLDKMGQASVGGRTVLFVSHNLAAVQGLCGRAIWLNGGEVAADGPTRTVVSHYLEQVSVSAFATKGRGANQHAPKPVKILKVVIRGTSGEPTLTLRPWEVLDVEVVYDCLERVIKPHFWIAVDSQFGPLFCSNMAFDGHPPEWIEGPGSLRCRFGSVALLPQSYTVRVGVCDATCTQDLGTLDGATMFSVVGSSRDYHFEGEMAGAYVSSSSPMLVPYEWQFPDGTVARPAWQRVQRVKELQRES
jgi:lipopolysaccharide transport system ATP-binding protein